MCNAIQRLFNDPTKEGITNFSVDKAKVEIEIPEIRITGYAMHKLTRYIDLCSTEIAGLGKIKIYNHSFEVYDIFILNQHASPASAVIYPEAISDYMINMVEQGEPTQDLKVWWHSHCDFGIFWSGVDYNMANSFSTDFMVGILGNKEHHFRCRLDQYEPWRVRIDDLPLRCPELEQIDQQLIAEIKEMVR